MAITGGIGKVRDIYQKVAAISNVGQRCITRSWTCWFILAYNIFDSTLQNTERKIIEKKRFNILLRQTDISITTAAFNLTDSLEDLYEDP